MQRLLRRKMLVALQQSPPEILARLTWSEYALTYTVGSSVLVVNTVASVVAHRWAMRTFNLSSLVVFYYTIALVFLITFGLYVFYVYIVDFLSPRDPKDATKQKSDGGVDRKKHE